MMPLPAYQAAALIRERIEELGALQEADADFEDWRERTETTLRTALKGPHTSLSKFTVLRFTPMSIGGPTSQEFKPRAFEPGRTSAAAILKAVLFELDLTETPDTSSAVLNVAEFRKVEEVTTAFQHAKQAGELDSLDRESMAEASLEIDVLNAQLRSPRPKRAIVKAALWSLGDILHRGLGSATGAGIVLLVQETVRVFH